MKILYILNQNSFPSATMSQTFILNQMTGLIDLGHDVQVVASSPMRSGAPMHPDVIAYDLLKRIRYFEPQLENKLQKIFCSCTVALKVLLARPRIFLRAVRVYRFCQREFTLNIFYLIAALLSSSEYDIINCHFGVNGRLAVVLRGVNALKGRIVTTFHGMDTRYNLEQEQELYKDLFSQADRLIAISSFNLQYLLSIGANSQKIVKQPMGVDTVRFAFRNNLRADEEGKIKILTVARLSQEKGLEFGIEAMAHLKAHNKALNFQYYIVGEGPELENLVSLIDRLNLRETVILLGAMDQLAVVKQMTESDIFILPSTREALPVVLMEAQAIGIPVITTDVGGAREVVIDGESGFIVAPRDVIAMVRKLEYLIGHPEIRLQMGKKGRKFVEEHYNIKVLNARLVEIYNKLINEG